MTTMEQHTDDEVGSEHAEQFAREHPGLVKFGRIGWAAKGVVYALTGFLALLIAFDRLPGASSTQGSPGQEASQSGAIARIAERTGGVPLLLVIVVGLVIYSCWRIVSALLPADSDASSWITRIGYLVSAVTYLVLAGLALSIAQNHRAAQNGAENTEDSKVESFTRDLLGHSYGRTVVFLVGVVLIGIAATFLWKGITASFRTQLAHRGVGPVSFDVHRRDGPDRVDRPLRDDGVDRVLPVPRGMAVQRRRGPGPRRVTAQGGDVRARHRARRGRGGRTAGVRPVLHHQCAAAAARGGRPLSPPIG